MATVAVSKQDQFNDIAVYTWAPLTTTNADGDPVAFQGSGDRTVQVQGTFGSGGSVTLQGSNDGTNWRTLVDPQGSAITATSAILSAIEQCPVFVRPFVTAGDGTTSLTVTLAVRRGR